MQYSIQGSDGNTYGPVDLPTLQQWANEGRVFPKSVITDHLTNTSRPANQMPELKLPISNEFANVPPAAAQYPRPGVAPVSGGLQNESHLGRVSFRAVLAIVLCVVFPIGGMISGAYCLYYGINAAVHKDKNATACLAISICTAVFVAIWSIVKMNHAVSPVIGNY